MSRLGAAATLSVSVATSERRSHATSSAAGLLVLAYAVCALQGCFLGLGGGGDGEPASEALGRGAGGAARRPAALEVCPSVNLPGSNAFIPASRVGEVVKVGCPRDEAYLGPPIECNWVDRLCVAAKLEDIDPTFCMNQFNFTHRGKGLLEWPEGLDPELVSPMTGGGTAATSSAAMPSAAAATNNRRRGRDLLPKVVGPKDVQCSEEPHVEFDFLKAKVLYSNLFGQGPDSDKPERVLYEKIATTASGRELDLEISARSRQGETPPCCSAVPARNGKRGASGRLSINSTKPVDLRFKFLEHESGEPAQLAKIFLTLLGISAGRGEDAEVVASGLSEYWLSKRSVVEVHRTGHAAYAFGGIAEGITPEDAAAKESEGTQAMDLWLDLLNRSAALVYRNVAEFSLLVSTPQGAQDLEFAGWSQVGNRSFGVKVVVAGDGASANSEAGNTNSIRYLQVARDAAEQGEISSGFFLGISPLRWLGGGLLTVACLIGCMQLKRQSLSAGSGRGFRMDEV